MIFNIHSSFGTNLAQARAGTLRLCVRKGRNGPREPDSRTGSKRLRQPHPPRPGRSHRRPGELPDVDTCKIPSPSMNNFAKLPLHAGEGWGEGQSTTPFESCRTRSGTHGGARTGPPPPPATQLQPPVGASLVGARWGTGGAATSQTDYCRAEPPHRHLMHPQPVIPSTPLLSPRAPSIVIPSEAEGPETVADPNGIVHEPTRTPPPSYRGHPVPTAASGRAGPSFHQPHPSSRRPTSSPSPVGEGWGEGQSTTLSFVIPGTPGTHSGARASGTLLPPTTPFLQATPFSPSPRGRGLG